MRLALVALLSTACGRIGFDDASMMVVDGSGSSSVAFDYGIHNIEAIINVTPIALTAIRTRGDNLTFTVEPALPTGLSIDGATGAITGVPAQSTDNTIYTVTAANSTGSASVELTATVLPGYVVDVGAVDGTDDDGGTDTTCLSAAAQGCTLRAAIQTVNMHTGKQLVLLGARQHVLGADLPSIIGQTEIAGALGAIVRASTPHTYRFTSIDQAFAGLWLKNIAFETFGGIDGGTLSVTAGSVTIDECTFENSTSAGKGGVLNVSNASTTTITDSTFLSNRSFGGNEWGGVINAEGTGTRVIVRRSYASNNSAGWGSFAHITSGTTLLLENSTLVENMSTISGTLASPGGVYTIVNSTIAHNTNSAADPLANAASAGIYLYSTPAHYDVTNSIIAFNTMSDSSETNCSRRDTMTDVQSGGGNILTDDGDNCGAYFTKTQDRLTTDPLLDATAADHGGPTLTLSLLSGSIAIDTATNACPPVDQRSYRRVGGCDVGAYEAE